MSDVYELYSAMKLKLEGSVRVADLQHTQQEIERLNECYPALPSVYEYWDFVHLHRTQYHLTQACVLSVAVRKRI